MNINKFRNIAAPLLMLAVGCDASASSLYFVQTDQLNTPRAITDQSNALVWKWDSDPYGSVPPNEQPAGGASFVFNLRFPGQVFDRETYIYYNYYRDYDPQIGRYVQSDPIGLNGGVNTYIYVGGNPVNATDPTGEFLVPLVTGVIGGAAGAIGNYVNQKYIQRNCEVDWGQVANAGAWGAVAGAILPMTGGLSGAATLGSAAGTGQYVTGQALSGSPLTASGAGIGAITGALGGLVGGAFTRTIGYGAVGTALPALAAQRQTSQALGANAGISNVIRNLAGGVIGGFDPNASSNQNCSCRK